MMGSNEITAPLAPHYRLRAAIRTSLLAAACILLAPGAGANDYIGIPIGGPVLSEPAGSGTQAPAEIIVEGPFDGMFAIFDRYRAHVSPGSRLLAMAKAQKRFTSFEACARETRHAWNRLEQRYGRPTRDANQAWWFDIGNRQRVSIDCKIYGASGKIAMNMTVVDAVLARRIPE